MNNIAPEQCELCGVTKQQLIDRHNNMVVSMKAAGGTWEHPAPTKFFVAHHWKGYQFPRDVWLICYSCNRKLEGKHDGSLTKEDARRYVETYYRRNDRLTRKDCKTMGIIEALKVLLAASGHEDWYEFAPAERHITTIAAQGTIGSLVAEFERLAPDWDDAPEWAQWATIFDNGKFHWWELQPKPKLIDGQWVVMEVTEKEIGRTKSEMRTPLAFGIDWRLCIWQRPEAA